MDYTLVIRESCVNSQRVMYAKEFKELSIEVIVLRDEAQWFLSINPRGNVPALLVRTNEKTVAITEVTGIIEIFESLGGKNVYPNLRTGNVNPLEKCIVDCHIKIRIEPLYKALSNITNGHNVAVNINSFKKTLIDIENRYLPTSKYMLAQFIYHDDLTLADISLFPIIDYFFFNYSKFNLNQNLPRIQTWYQNLKSQPWLLSASSRIRL